VVLIGLVALGVGMVGAGTVGAASLRSRDLARAAAGTTTTQLAAGPARTESLSSAKTSHEAKAYEAAPSTAPPSTALFSADGPVRQYSFEVTNSAGEPVRWDPCKPVSYAVVDVKAPPGWQADVAFAISQAQAATGLDLVDAGAFASGRQVPSSVDITISWTAALPATADEVGLTTYYYINDPRYTPEMTKADIQLLSSLHAGGGTDGELPVLLHEMGHALGMGHAPGQPEVMNPYDHGFTRYQPGDLQGLRLLGASQGCSGFYQP